MSDRVYVLDTTLRDGEQTPGVSLTPEEKVQLARQLDKLGVDVIEAGFPIASEGELQAAKEIARERLSAKTCVLARAVRTDLDKALETDADRIHVFIATSDVHLEHKLKLTKEEAFEKAVQAVEYVKSHGVEVEFSAEDATRTEMEYLLKVYRGVAEAGASYLDIPDTVGLAYPEMMAEIVTRVRQVARGSVVSVHCHNDFGLAVANTIAGVRAGAKQFHATINGLGERAGNASLEESVMALTMLHHYKTGVNARMIYETSRLVTRLTGVYVQPNKAIVGDNAFGHESGIHTHGLVEDQSTYEPMKPEMVGRKRWFSAGKHAGLHGIGAQLGDMGVEPSEGQLGLILAKVKEVGDLGKKVTDADLLAIAGSVMGQLSAEQKAVHLQGFVAVTGHGVMPTASVSVLAANKEYRATQIGDGPVDAAMKAIQETLKGTVNVRLSEYRLEAITGGSNALAEVTVKVEDEGGLRATARVIGPDVILTSVESMIEGINKLMLKRAHQK